MYGDRPRFMARPARAKPGLVTVLISVSTMLPPAAAGVARQAAMNSSSPGVAAPSPVPASARNMKRAKHSRTLGLSARAAASWLLSA